MLVQDKINFLDSGVRELNEVILMEGSAVTFGANPETGVFNVSKDDFSPEYLEKLNKKMNGYINALKNPNRTDENLEQIENNLKG